jgi:uncharacterized phiE125 gp8 family phage protein
MSLVLVTAPTVEPLSLDDAKLHLRLEPDFTDDDDLVTALIQAAREHVESKTHRALLPQAWRLRRDCFPCGDEMSLEASDVTAVTSFTYVDPSGVSTDFSAYALDTDAMPARILRNYGSSWPATRVQRNAIAVTFTRAMAPDADNLPQQIKAAMKLLVGTWYENREAFVESRFALEVPFSVDALLSPYVRLAAGMA